MSLRKLEECSSWPRWPIFGVEHRKAVERVISSNQLFADQEVAQFEAEFSNFLGVEYSIGVGNATQGLHLALAALDIGEGDEVIVTPYSWISSASCVLMQNAVPIFCDIEPDSLGLSPTAVEEKISARTKAIILVHMFGYPARVEEFQVLSERYGIAVIEDASHSHGALKNGKPLGSFGKISVFSLHQRKSLPVGDGGVICTSDAHLFEKMRMLRSFGHRELSYNYRMTEFAGALGQVGLRNLREENLVRQRNVESLAGMLDGSDQYRVRIGNKDDQPAYYAALIEVVDPPKALDFALAAMQDRGIPIRKTWKPLHRHAHFNPEEKPARGIPWEHVAYTGEMRGRKYRELDFPVADNLIPDKIIELYVHPNVALHQIEEVAELLEQL